MRLAFRPQFPFVVREKEEEDARVRVGRPEQDGAAFSGVSGETKFRSGSLGN